MHEEQIEIASKPKPLTAANLEAASQKSSKAPSKKGGRKAQKPAWAMTADQTEEAKEAEIDDLLEFAYELDYEKYMEDYEVRQALAIIKDRVQEITAQPDWKDQMANEWNAAQDAERAAAKQPKKAVDPDAQSSVTYRKYPFLTANSIFPQNRIAQVGSIEGQLPVARLRCPQERG